MYLIRVVVPLTQALLLYYVVTSVTGKEKNPKPWTQGEPAPKHANPNQVRDRTRRPNMSKPQMPEAWNNRNKKPFDPAWMDYCDPYHCNDYHQQACGLNRKSMRFKWFQSTCHLILNNQCAYFQGLMKFDLVETKFCYQYVMHIRSGCPQYCEDDVTPVCALTRTNQPVLFKNQCALDMANCGAMIEPYQEAKMDLCDYYWQTS